MSARELRNEINVSNEELRGLIQKLSQNRSRASVKDALASAYKEKQDK